MTNKRRQQEDCRYVKLSLCPYNLCEHKKIQYAGWPFYDLGYELYDVIIASVTFWRSVEQCSAERFLRLSTMFFQKRGFWRARDRLALVVLTEREKPPAPPRKGGDNDG